MTRHFPPFPQGISIPATDAAAIAAAGRLAEIWLAGAARIDRDRSVPEAELRAFEASGLLAITVPAEVGGPGLSQETLAKVFIILGAADTALAQIGQNHFDFVDALAVARPETQALFYPQILAGARFGNALAEPGRKSRRDLATTIRPDPEGWRIDGRKYFSTGALTAHFVPVHALHADGRILIALVPRKADGIDVLTDWDAFGQKATFSGTTVLDGVLVPDSHVIDRAEGSATLATAQFAGNQLIHAAIEAGCAEGAVQRGYELLADRPDPLALDRLATLAAGARAARALVLRAARLVDRALLSEGGLPTEEAAIAAAYAVDEAKSLAYEIGPEAAGALPALASPAQFARYGLDRIWRNSRVHTLHDPLRWRQHFTGDQQLNNEPGHELKLRLKLVDPS